MNKPNGYEDTYIGGDFIPVNVGGHTATIIGLEETTSKAGKPMVKIAIDFDDNDTQAAYFMEMFQADDRPDKKWPFNAVQYILTEDANGKCSRSFKSFISSVERSNNSECVWGKGFADWFKGKKIGVVYGLVEEEYNGKVSTRRRIRYFCQYDKAKDASIPEPRLLDNNNNTKTTLNEGFMDVSEVKADYIPF